MKAPATLRVLASVLTLSCGGPAEVVVTPKPLTSAVASTPSASVSAVADVVAPLEPPKGRVAGSAFTATPDEPLPPGAIARCGTTAMRTKDRGPFAITNDGVIYVLRDNEQLLDLRKNEVVAKLPRFAQAVFSPDAEMLVTLHSTNVIELFAIPSGKSLGSSKLELSKPQPLPGKRKAGLLGGLGTGEYVRELEFSLDGTRFIATTNRGAFHVFDGSNAKRLKTIKVPDATLAGLSRNGTRALVLLGEPGQGGESPFMMMSVSPNAIGLAVIDLTTGAKVLTKKFPYEEADNLDPDRPKARKHKYAVHGLSLDGLTVYREEFGDLSSIDVATGAEEEIADTKALDAWGGFGLGMQSMIMEPDGTHARIGSRRVSLATGHTEAVESFAFRSENGAYELQRTGSVLHVASEDIVGHKSGVAALSFLPRGEALVTADGSLHFWDASSCSELGTPKINASDFRSARDAGVLVIDGYPTLIVHGKGDVTELKDALRARNLAVTNDGTRLFLGTSDYEDADLEVRDAVKGDVLASVPLEGSTDGIAISPSGSRVAVLVSKDGTHELQIRKGDTLALEVTAPDSRDRIQFLGEDSLVTWDGYRGISELTIPSMKEGFKLGAGNCCSSIAISKDQRRIAGAADTDVFVWELSEPQDGAISAKFLAQLSGHTERVTSLAFSAEGVLATGSEDTTVLLWDIDASSKQPVSSHRASTVAGPTLASRWGSGEYRARDYIADDGTVIWSNTKAKQPVLTGVVSLTRSYSSTCAITAKPAGKVLCWGSTRGGALGVPEKPGAKPYQFLSQETPIEVPNVSDAVRVELAADYGCALHAGGKLSCWGRLKADAVAGPKEVMSGVVSFGIQPERACALTTAGELKCWESSANPVGVRLASGVASFGMGRSHVCVLGSDAKVSCLGTGGRLGLGTNEDRKLPVLVDRLSNVTELAVASAGTCARAKPSDGEEGVYCWGDFAHARHVVPTLMRGLSDTTGVLLLDDRACAAKSAGVVCLGK